MKPLKSKTPNSAEAAPEVPTAGLLPPVFPQTMHQVREHAPVLPPAKASKHANGKSRDTREDRGERQMKTAHNAQTFPHPH